MLSENSNYSEPSCFYGDYTLLNNSNNLTRNSSITHILLKLNGVRSTIMFCIIGDVLNL